MKQLTGIRNASGLGAEERAALEELLDVGESVLERNTRLVEYYEGDARPKGIGVDTIPPTVDVDACCSWPRKAVTSVSERSHFDGFVFASGEDDPALARVVRDNALVGAYNRAVPGELLHGCMFATVGRAENGSGAFVRFHTAETASATWDAGEGRIGSGLVVADWRRTPYSPSRPVPVQANMHLPGRVVVLRRMGAAEWAAEGLKTPLDRPMMEAFAFRASGVKPFGESRISRDVMSIADAVVRTLEDMAVSAAFYANPLKYMLGLTDEQFDEMSKDKWSAVSGAMLLSTRDPETGDVPAVGQLAATSPQPYIDMLRTYAAMFSAATGVPLNSLGIVQDNPSSAEAIAAAREDICIAAQDLNEAGGEGLRNVALMAMAVEGNCRIDQLTGDQQSVMAHFRDPSMPSVVSQADAAVKIASADAGFSGTDVFYEMLGFDKATVARIKGDRRRNSATEALREIMASPPRGGSAAAGGSEGSGE